MPHDSGLLTTGEAARKLAVTEETIRRWIGEERLAAIRLPSGQYRVRAAAIDAILNGDLAGTR